MFREWKVCFMGVVVVVNVIVVLFLPLSFTPKPPKRAAIVIFPFLWYNHANHLIHWSSAVYQAQVVLRILQLCCQKCVPSTGGAGLWIVYYQFVTRCLKTLIATKQSNLWILIKPFGFYFICHFSNNSFIIFVNSFYFMKILVCEGLEVKNWIFTSGSSRSTILDWKIRLLVLIWSQYNPMRMSNRKKSFHFQTYTFLRDI